ncbi:MAG: hypothetical protein HQM14_20415 [SAR324 cluster bacterium]|nr:hypothetical protein [SAR324 cluster bacterium]
MKIWKLRGASANILFGLAACSLGVWGLSSWWWSIAEFLRGMVPIVLIFVGLVAIGAGVTPKRDKESSKDK